MTFRVYDSRSTFSSELTGGKKEQRVGLSRNGGRVSAVEGLKVRNKLALNEME